jgi:glycosyltransferase involved in cell wall biosynthesis
LYQDAEAVVLPSRREGLPLSLLEAGAAGAICIGSRTPGIPEIIQDGVTGYLTDTESVDDLVAGIKKALSLSPEARWRMKQAAQDAVRDQYSEQRMVNNYLQLFESVVTQNTAMVVAPA